MDAQDMMLYDHIWHSSRTSPPTAEDFAECLGFRPSENNPFTNLEERRKTPVINELFIKLGSSASEHETEMVYRKFAASYLPATVDRLLNPPSLPEGTSQETIDDFGLDNAYHVTLNMLQHTPYFFKFLRSQKPLAEGGKRLVRTISSRVANLAPIWDRRMGAIPLQVLPVSDHSDHWQDTAIKAIQTLSTLLAAFVKEPMNSPIMVTLEVKRTLLIWFKKWEARYGGESFLGGVCSRTRYQLTGQLMHQMMARQLRSTYKNWEVCGHKACDKSTGLKACGRCQTVRYCSSEHQKLDWVDLREPHKMVCYHTEY